MTTVTPYQPHALVTGASSGIGAAISRRLARSGYRLTLLARDRARLEAVAADCVASGAPVDIRLCCVADTDSMEKLLLRCDEIVPIDVIVANAGLGGVSSLAGPDGEDIRAARRVIETNLIGVVNTVTPVLPRMMARHRGHLVIISSLAGRVGLPLSPSYCASKGALDRYADAVRRLAARQGVKVSIVFPGYVDTPMSATLPFAKPFIWSADRAAIKIAGVLETGRLRLEFPWTLAALTRLVNALPTRAADLLIAAASPRLGGTPS